MDKDKTNRKKYVPYDVFEERKWLFFIVGYAPTNNIIYIIYVGLLFVLQLFVEAMAVYAAFLLSSKKSLVFNAIHVISASWFAVWGLATKFFANRSLRKAMKEIKRGIYIYQEEELDDEQIKMNEGIPDEIKKKSTALTFMYAIGFFSNTVFFPLSQFILLDEDNEKGPDFLNPYLPHVFYIPFNTRSTVGYIIIYIMDFSFILFIYATAICLNSIFITCTVMVKTHYRVLNHSIKMMQKRAYLRYMKSNNIEPGKLSEGDLISTKEFQNCMYFCLKQNVMHHQALLRFRADCRLFVGSVLLDIFVLSALIYATILYQMYQTLPLNVLVNYTCTSLAEQTYIFFICAFGEEVIGASGKIFLTLYSIDWWHCNDKFKRTLGIMMVNARKPIDFKGIILTIPASIETYGDSLTCMYKVMSLARQTDALH